MIAFDARELILSLRCSATGFVLLSALILSPLSGQSSVQSLLRQTNGWWRIDGEAPYQSAVTLQVSANLSGWTEIAVLHPRAVGFSTTSSPFIYLDPQSTNMSRRFYRFSAVSLQSTNNWKNQVDFPLDDFLVGRFLGANEEWIKFIIVTNEPARVFYSSCDFPYYYDFAVTHLQPFRGVSPADFNRQTLFATNRCAWIGTVLYPKVLHAAEYGIQFARRNCLHPNELEALRMRCDGKNCFSYNAQAVVDDRAEVIVAAQVANLDSYTGLTGHDRKNNQTHFFYVKVCNLF